MPNSRPLLLGLMGTVALLTGGPPQAARAEASMQHADKELIAAVRAKDVAAVTRLIAAGADLEARDGRGRGALMLATHADAVEIARLLIDAGADVNAKDDLDDTPYLYAGAEGRLEILRMTVAAGADLADTNRYGGTALIPAAHHGHLATVRYLLTTAIDLDHVNRLGWTAVLETVILGDGGPTHQAILRALLEAGADAGIADDNGVTALEHARRRGYTEMVRLLSSARFPAEQ